MCWTRTSLKNWKLKQPKTTDTPPKHMESSVAPENCSWFQNDKLQIRWECGTFIPLHHIQSYKSCKPYPLEIHLHIFTLFWVRRPISQQEAWIERRKHIHFKREAEPFKRLLAHSSHDQVKGSGAPWPSLKLQYTALLAIKRFPTKAFDEKFVCHIWHKVNILMLCQKCT